MGCRADWAGCCAQRRRSDLARRMAGAWRCVCGGGRGRGRRLALLRRRCGRRAIFAADANRQEKCRAAEDRLGIPHRRRVRRQRRPAQECLRGDADRRLWHDVCDDTLQPRRGARSGDRHGKMAVRSADRPSGALFRRLDQPRRHVVDRSGEIRRPALPAPGISGDDRCAALCARRRDRQALRRFRRFRPDRPEARHRQHYSPGRVRGDLAPGGRGRSRHRRLGDRRQRPGGEPERRSARVRRAQRRAALELEPDPGEPRPDRRRQCLAADFGRCGARPRLSADHQRQPRLFRRAARGRRQMGRFRRRLVGQDRQARLGVPARAPRSVGLRHRRPAGSRHPAPQGCRDAGRHPREQDRQSLCARARDRQAGFRRRRAPGAKERRRRRRCVADTALSARAAAPRAAAPRRIRGVGCHTAGARGLSRGNGKAALRRDFHTAGRARDHRLSGQSRGHELERRRL